MEILISPYSRKLRNGTKNPKNYPYFQDLINKIKLIGECHIVQVGIGDEKKLKDVDEYFFDKTLDELKEKILHCDFWISVDNFLHHLGALLEKKGVVIWGQSDPKIFGYEENLNILKDRKYLRKGQEQYWLWTQTKYNEEVFIGPQEIIKIMIESGLLKI